MTKALGRYLVLSALLALVAACARKSRASDAGPSASSSPSARTGAPFVDPDHGFSIRYPDGQVPTKVHMGTSDTAMGRVEELSYYTSVGDTAYDVTVSVYPPGKLSPDVDGLLGVLREEALSKPGAKLVTERRVFVQSSRGQRIPAHFMEIDLNDARVFRVTCFFGNFGYIVSSGGRLGDPALSPASFDEFVGSFRALESSSH